MMFRDIFPEFSAGKPVKLKHWDGYWVYDFDTATVVIHTKDGVSIDLMDTPDVLFSIAAFAQDDWQLATEGNSPVLNKEMHSNIMEKMFGSEPIEGTLTYHLSSDELDELEEEEEEEEGNHNNTLEPFLPAYIDLSGGKWKYTKSNLFSKEDKNTSSKNKPF